MKKISIFLMLLMGVLLPWAASAQSVTIGDGTSTSQYLPSNSYYNYAISQQIYTADEINASGNITSIAFYNAGTGTAANNARMFDIYMAHTSKTYFNSSNDWIALTNSDIVYHGTADMTLTPNTWTTFTLNTQFAYNGTDNLVVCVIDRSADYTSSNHNSFRVFSTGSEYQAIYKYGDGLSSLNPDGTNGTSAQTYSRSASKSQIILGGIQQSCAKPTNLAAALTQGNGTIATLSWTENGQATSWVLQVATNDAFTANLQSYTVNNTPSQNLTSLTAERTYYARVQPACDNNNKYWSATCEFTPTNAYIVTLSEGTTTSSASPLYGNYNSSYDQMIYTASQLEAAGITGPCTINKIGFNSSDANENARKPIIYICQTDKSSFSSTTDFISINEFTKVYDFNDHSQWNITAGWNEFELDTPFDYDGSSNLVVAVHCGMASYKSTSFYCSTTTSNQVIYAYHDSTDPIPATYEGNWTNYPTTGASATSYKAVSTYLPSLKLYYAPIAVTCAKPTGLAVVANSLTAHGVAVQWDSEANAVYDYAIVKGTGIDPTTVTYAGSETATGTTCSHTWSSGLDADSDYTVFIRKNCGNGDYSTAATKVIHTEIACPAPTALACTAFTATTASFSWTAGASESNWVLQYGTDNTFAAGTYTEITTGFNTQAAPTITFNATTGLTAETVHYARVQAACGGIDGSSDWSNTVSFEPSAKQLITGETTGTNSNLPSNTNYDFSYTQQIYTVAELGTAGIIESIDFYMTSTSDYTRSLDVYMVATDKNSFTGNSDWINVSAADLVFSGSVAFIAQSWTTITLDEPFLYDGSQNVAIIVDDNTDAWSSRYFSTFTAEANQSLYASRDDTNINPSAPSGSFSYNSVTTAKNQIRILKSPLSGCLKPTSLTATVVDGHNVTLSWKENGSATAWEINKGDGSQNVSINDQTTGVTFDGTNVTYTLGGLTAETTYSVTVRGNCGGTDGDSDWSNPVSFTTDVACPAPTLQPVSGITNNSATISWTGSEAGSFDVRYRAIDTVYFEGFERGIPSTWTKNDADEDGNNWLALSEIPTTYSAYSTLSLSGWAHSGTDAASSPSFFNDPSKGSLTTDHWLITPALTLDGTLKFYASSTYSDLDSYEVLLSTTGTATTDFTVTLQAMKEAPYGGDNNPTVWDEVSIDLSSYAGQQGYIAIHHVSSDKYFLVIDDFGIYGGTWQTPVNSPVSTNSITLTSLDAETLYEVEVQANCGNGDGESAWVGTSFTTLSNCSAPYELNVTELTENSAKLNWTGSQNSYNVRFRELTPGETTTTTEDFEHSGSMPTGWTMLDLGDGENTAELGVFEIAAQNGTYGFRFSSYDGDSDGDFDQYLISPELDNLSALSFAFKSSNGTYDKFRIGYSTTTNDVSAFTWGEENNSASTWTTYTEDVENIPANAKYFAINYTAVYAYRLYIDNITYTYTPMTAGAWNTDNTNVNSELTINNLAQNTKYEWQVQGINSSCDGDGEGHTGVTEWSEMASFTTFAKFTKTIAAVDATVWAEGKGGYYLIASPLAADVDPTTITGMTTGDYDLYAFDQTEELEWQNYKAGSFDLVNGQGYLYANKNGVTLTFTGVPYSGDGKVTLSKATDAEFAGWNLVGNPFGEDAYITKDFYTLENSDTYTENTAGTAINAMQGLLVIADNNNETLTFSTTAPTKKAAKLNMNVSKDRGVVDHAIVSFSEGHQLPKLQFRQNSTKVYLPKDGKDYAIVSTESNVGEMPVNFKAEDNGTYTLNFTTEEVSFAYLHLIDNMTGIETDLLANPSYSFNAKTSDYENRFKLVFATGNSTDDTFAFFSNGSFVINNEGEATLQVIDINGRILKSESINGCANVNVKAAQGVYMLRLVNGDSVKVQKVVVR